MMERLAHYEILDMLGTGSLGSVYRARDTKLGRDVALKVLPATAAISAAFLQQLQREACAASGLNHPNICEIYEVGKHQDQHFIAMELLEGQTLRALLQGKPLPTEPMLHIAIQIGDALTAAHAKGILHQNIKPENIFISPRGQVKVVDFGLARLASVSRIPPRPEPVGASGPPQRIALEYVSSPHATIGALPYMAPEQTLGEDLDCRSDLFSLGSVLYEMATGHSPFTGKTQPVLFQEILAKMPVPPIRLNPEVPPILNELICRLHEKDRELRPQTAADVNADLKRAKRDFERKRAGAPDDGPMAAAPEGSAEDAFASSLLADPHSSRKPQALAGCWHFFRKPKIVLAAAAAVVLVLAVSAYFVLNRSSYFPYIAFESFSGGSQSVDAQIVGFALKRTLSQFPDFAVLDGQEFVNLSAIERARKQTASSKAAGHSRWRRLLPQPREIQEPAIRISGQVRDSLGRLEVRLNCNVRGKEEELAMQFRGVDDLLNSGIDSLAIRLLHRYDARIAERHIANQMRDYRKAVRLLSSHWDAVRYYYRGAAAWQRRDIYSAERELRSALEVDPNLALAHLLLGEMRVWQNQWDAAQSDILAARARAGALLDVDQLRVEALLSRAFSEPFKERDYLHRLIGLQPYRGEYLYDLAESYFHTADVDEAIARYLDALKLDRNYALSYNHLAYSYAWKGEHARALDACRKYLELHQSANAYDSIGEIHMLAGDYARAEQMKRKAIQMDPQIYYAGRNLAYIEMMRGRNKAAEERLKRLLAATENRVQRTQFYAALAFLYYRKGDLAAARNMCEQGARLLGSVRYEAPHDELIWIMGMIEIQRRNLPAARHALAQLRRILDSNSINAMNFKPAYKYWIHLHAWILAEEGRYAEAKEAVNDLKWIKFKLGYWNKPFDCAFFFDAVGQIYEKMRQAADAEKAYRESLAYNPHFAFSRFHLAQFLKNSGRPAEARRELEAFWKEWQGADPDAVESIEALRLAAALRWTE